MALSAVDRAGRVGDSAVLRFCQQVAALNLNSRKSLP